MSGVNRMRRFTIACASVMAVAAAGCSTVGGYVTNAKTIEGFEGPARSKSIGFDPLTAFSLAGRANGLDDRVMRARLWTIDPGGVVPIHTHRNRPAFVYVLSGSVLEYRNTLAEPHRVNAGELSAEGLGVVHYWRNDGDVPAHLYAVDLYQDTSRSFKDAMPEGAIFDKEDM